jgi:tetratricopeptide (TPR) repeat protein
MNNRAFTKQKKGNTDAKIKAVRPWFYAVAAAIPVLFFVLLETSLHIFNYGSDYKQWVNVTADKYMLNPDLCRRYFYTTASVPYSNQNTFDVNKKPNSFRVFILGESSAAGYPYTPNGDFGRYIRKRLEASYPSAVIEVVNLGITAVNSYTIRDIMPGVLEQKPDLILIYTGHNEYYGALGVGSLESVGKSPFIVNTALYLNRFRTFQLARNIIKSAMSVISGSSHRKEQSGTLMSRMAQDKQIQLNSDVYKAGLSQYESNMTDVLKMAKNAGVKVILSTVAFNLKDQPPFIPAKTAGYMSADKVFASAKKYLEEKNIHKADSLFRLAKDLDALKFRAPEELNKITIKLAHRFNYPVIEADKEFNLNSPDSITGNNLMVDHLHPTLAGYKLLGKLFYNKMEETSCLPKFAKADLSDAAADSTARSRFCFSTLDSTVAAYRIIVLKNDWPFSKPQSAAYVLKLFNPHNHIDTIAIKIIENSLSWEAGHRQAATYYFNHQQYDLFRYEIDVLTDQYPFITEYYADGSENLIRAKQYGLAYGLLEKSYKNSPTPFNTKWLGAINLFENKIGPAIKYLEESSLLDNSDAQVFFNLAGAYSIKKEYKKALTAVNRCIEINPNFPQAQGLRQQIAGAAK